MSLISGVLAAHAALPELQRVADADIQGPWHDKAASPGELRLAFKTPEGDVMHVMLKPQTRLLRASAEPVALFTHGVAGIYAGTVEGSDTGWARLTQMGEAWSGAVFDGKTLWFLDPARYHTGLTEKSGIAAAGTVAFSMADIEGEANLSADMAHPPFDPVHAYVPFSKGEPLPEYELAVTLVLDTEFQEIYEEDSVSTALAVLNVVDGLYAQVNTRVVLHHIEVLEDNETLDTTDYAALLNRFSSFARSKDIPFRGVSHLLSGKVFDGSVVGYAYMRAVCSRSSGYGIDQMTNGVAYNATLLAHEIGHNFGAGHDNEASSYPPIPFPACMDDPGIMWPSINAYSPATTFSWCSRASFEHFLSTPRACLIPQWPLLSDGFESSPK